MGNTALQRWAASLIRRSAAYVKNVPEGLLAVSLLKRSLSLQNVELQERLLEDALGVVLPLKVNSAWLEEVEVLMGSRICIVARRICIHGAVRSAEEWVPQAELCNQHRDSDRSLRLAAHESLVASILRNQARSHISASDALRAASLEDSPRWHALLNGLELDVDIKGVEIILHDNISQQDSPFCFVGTAQRFTFGQPLDLGGIVHKQKPTWILDLLLERMSISCVSCAIGTRPCCYHAEEESDMPVANEQESIMTAMAGEGFSREGQNSFLPSGELHAGSTDRILPAKGKAAGIMVDIENLPDDEVVIGPFSELQLNFLFSHYWDSHESDAIGRTFSPSFNVPECMTDSSVEPLLPGTRMALRASGGGVRLTQAQLTHIIAHGRTWGLWNAMKKALQLHTPSSEDACTYRQAWERGVIAKARDERISVDSVVPAFESQYPVYIVMYHRRLVMLELSKALSNNIEAPIGRSSERLETGFVCSCEGAKSRCGTCNPQREPTGELDVQPARGLNSYGLDPTHRTTFVLDVNLVDTEVELRTDDYHGKKQAFENESCESLRSETRELVAPCLLRVTQLREDQPFTVRYGLDLNDHPALVPVSSQLYLTGSRLELHRIVERPMHSGADQLSRFIRPAVAMHTKAAMSVVPLLEIQGSLYHRLDLLEHSDGEFCEELQPKRAYVGLEQASFNVDVEALECALGLVVAAADPAALAEDPSAARLVVANASQSKWYTAQEYTFAVDNLFSAQDNRAFASECLLSKLLDILNGRDIQVTPQPNPFQSDLRVNLLGSLLTVLPLPSVVYHQDLDWSSPVGRIVVEIQKVWVAPARAWSRFERHIFPQNLDLICMNAPLLLPPRLVDMNIDSDSFTSQLVLQLTGLSAWAVKEQVDVSDASHSLQDGNRSSIVPPWLSTAMREMPNPLVNCTYLRCTAGTDSAAIEVAPICSRVQLDAEFASLLSAIHVAATVLTSKQGAQAAPSKTIDPNITNTPACNYSSNFHIEGLNVNLIDASGDCMSTLGIDHVDIHAWFGDGYQLATLKCCLKRISLSGSTSCLLCVGSQDKNGMSVLIDRSAHSENIESIPLSIDCGSFWICADWQSLSELAQCGFEFCIELNKANLRSSSSIAKPREETPDSPLKADSLDSIDTLLTSLVSIVEETDSDKSFPREADEDVQLDALLRFIGVNVKCDEIQFFLPCDSTCEQGFLFRCSPLVCVLGIKSTLIIHQLSLSSCIMSRNQAFSMPALLEDRLRFLLHPMRLQLRAEVYEEPGQAAPQVDTVLEIEPMYVCFHTGDVELVLGLKAQIELWTLGFISEICTSADSSRVSTTGTSDDRTPLAGNSVLPIVNCNAFMPILQISLVHTSSRSEVCVAMLEETTLIVGLALPTYSLTFTAESIVSVNVLMAATKYTSPFLEPTHIKFIYTDAKVLTSELTWVNLTLSAEMASTLFSLVSEFNNQLKRYSNSQLRHPLRNTRSEPEAYQSDTFSVSKVLNSLSEPVHVRLPGDHLSHYLNTFDTLPVFPYVTEVGIDAHLVVSLEDGWSKQLSLLPMVQVVQLDRASESHDDDEQAYVPHWVLARKLPCNDPQLGLEGTGMVLYLTSLISVLNRTSVTIVVVALEERVGGPHVATGNTWLTLEPGTDGIETQPIPLPLSWCTQSAQGQHCSLWCGLMSTLQLGHPISELSDERLRELLDERHLQPLLSRNTWLQMINGVTKSRNIGLRRSMVADHYDLHAKTLDGDMAGLCTTVYGISERLQAHHKGLYFSVAIEPTVQVCNRLHRDVQVQTETETQFPGEESMDSWQILTLPPGEDGFLEIVCGKLNLKILDAGDTQMVLDNSLQVEELQGKQMLYFHSDKGEGLEAILRQEDSRAPYFGENFEVFGYAPLTKRFVLFTSHWLLNRCKDCQLFVPSPSETAAVGESHCRLRHVPNNSLRMLSNHVVRKNSIRIGICNHYCDARANHIAKPVSKGFQCLDQQESGVVVVPAGRRPPARCFGYVVRTAPPPFYRTLLIEVTRRYTLLNHKSHSIWCFEKGSKGGCFELRPDDTRPLDPLREKPKLAITGVAGQTIADNAVSSFFGISGDWKRGERFQLLHQVALDDGACEMERSVCLVQSEPVARTKHIVKASSHQWCITEVELLHDRDSGAVVVRFSNPIRPEFRIFNRSKHTIKIFQDCNSAPSFDVSPDHKTAFTWFKPFDHKPRMVAIAEGDSAKWSFYIDRVQKHKDIKLEPRAEHGFELRKTQLNLDHLHVRTLVRAGGREVHIHPWCVLTNRRPTDLAVRVDSQEFLEETVGGGCLCYLPPPKAESLHVQVRDCTSGHVSWSEIVLGQHMLGHSGILELSGGLTKFEVQCDRVSNFLQLNLCPCTIEPFVLENRSELYCTMKPCSRKPQNNCIDLAPNSKISFCPTLKDMDANDAREFLVCAGSGDPFFEVIVNLRKPRDTQFGPLEIKIHPGWPRRMVIHDSLGSPSRLSMQQTNKLGAQAAFVGLKQSMGWLTNQMKHRVQVAQGALAKGASKIAEHRNRQRLGHHRLSSIRSKVTRQPKVSPGSSSSGPLRTSDSYWDGPPSSDTKSRGSLNSVLNTARKWSLQSLMSLDTETSNISNLSPNLSPEQPQESSDFLTPDQVELRIAGLGVTLLDATALHEVGHLRVNAISATHSSSSNHFQVEIHEVQFDASDGRKETSVPILSPWRDWRQVFKLGSDWTEIKRQRNSSHRRHVHVHGKSIHKPLVLLTCVLRRAEGGGHVEIQDLVLSVRAFELQIDTKKVLALAQWALDMEKTITASTKQASRSSNSDLLAARAGLLSRSMSSVSGAQIGRGGRTGHDLIAQFREGVFDDPLVGEPRLLRSPEHSDFAIRVPLFVRWMCVHRVDCYLSVRFTGDRSRTATRGDERMEALEHWLRLCLPLDVSQARIILGKASRYRWITARIKDVNLSDCFFSNGLSDLLHVILQDVGIAVLKQVGNILGSQRLIGNPARLLPELAKACALIGLAVMTLDVRMLFAALLLGLAAIVNAVEGIFLALGKPLCRASTGKVPAALQREPSSATIAMKHGLVYSLPWHLKHISREWKRLLRHAQLSKSTPTRVWCILVALARSVGAIGSVLLLFIAKMLQALELLLRQAASRVCPDRATPARPLPCRSGPQQFRRGVAIQFSDVAAKAFHALRHKEAVAVMCGDWRIRTLPNTDGALIAIRGEGLFLVRPRRRFSERWRIEWEVTGALGPPELLRPPPKSELPTLLRIPFSPSRNVSKRGRVSAVVGAASATAGAAAGVVKNVIHRVGGHDNASAAERAAGRANAAARWGAVTVAETGKAAAVSVAGTGKAAARTALQSAPSIAAAGSKANAVAVTAAAKANANMYEAASAAAEMMHRLSSETDNEDDFFDSRASVSLVEQVLSDDDEENPNLTGARTSCSPDEIYIGVKELKLDPEAATVAFCFVAECWISGIL